MEEAEAYFYDALPDIFEQYKLAYEKHPDFEHQGPAAQVVGEEFGEICKALNDGDPHNAVVEIDQTITTLLKWRRKIQEGIKQ